MTQKGKISRRLRISWRKTRHRIANGLFTFRENKRLRWAFYLLLVITPVVKFLYLLFPEDNSSDFFLQEELRALDLFLINFFHLENKWPSLRDLLFLHGETLSPLTAVFGIFLLFPKRYYPAYLLGVPFGYYLSIAGYRIFTQYRAGNYFEGFSWPLTLLFIVAGIIILTLADRLLFRQLDPRRATEARIISLVNLRGVSWQEKEALLKKEVDKLTKMNNELFEKKKKPDSNNELL